MGTLYIVATPIGNREDITLRAIRILFTVPIIMCEDTRRTGLLLHYYREQYVASHPEGEKRPKDPDGFFSRRFGRDQNDILNKPKLISFYDEVEEQKIPEIIDLLNSGKDVALVSDAGTPLISDPGFKLVRECHKQHIPVSPIPGPSSITAALSASGLPTDKFLYIGYLPKKQGKRRQVLEHIKKLKEDDVVKTIVLLETPHHIEETFSEIREVLGNVEVSVAHELTKVYESVVSGSVDSLTPSSFVKGESVVLIKV